MGWSAKRAFGRRALLLHGLNLSKQGHTVHKLEIAIYVYIYKHIYIIIYTFIYNTYIFKERDT